MTIVWKPTSVVRGFWFLDAERIPGANFNWIAVVMKDAEGPWYGLYRFRYIVDDNLGRESKDERSWYEITAPDGEARSAEHVFGALDAVAVRLDRELAPMGAKLYRFDFEKGKPALEVYERLQQEPFFHASTTEGPAS